jgi:hypothetical protein
MYSDQKRFIPYGDQVTAIPKVAAQDTTLTVSNADGGMTTFPVPSGTEIDLHVPGLHHNRTLDGFASCGHVLMEFHSAVLEGTTPVHARAVPWQLAEGRIYSFQSRYCICCSLYDCTHKSRTLCRCPRLSGKTVRAIVIYVRAQSSQFFQVLRDRGNSRHDYACVEV